MDNEPRLDKGHSSKKRIKLWIIIGAVLLIAGLTAVAFSLFGGHRIEGNEGVLALYDFVRTYEQSEEAATDGLYKTIGQRLLSEAFEIGTDVEIEAEGLSIMGLPLPRMKGNLDIKYDMNDLGLKLKALGFDVLGLYLIGGDIVVDAGGAVQAETVGAAPEGELPLKERIALLLPNLPEADAQQRVFEALAQSIPKEATQFEQAIVYSPMQNADVEAEAVVTRLDAQELSKTAAAMLEHMKADAALSADVQAVYMPIARYLNEKDAISALTKLAESAAEDARLEWTVFRRDGVPFGYQAAVRFDGREYEWSVMAEFEGKARYERVMVRPDSENTMTLAYNIDLENGTVRGDIEAGDVSIGFDGTLEAEEYTNDAYAIKAALLVSGEVPGIQLSDAKVNLRADIRFGSGLDTLKQTRGWRDIYEKEALRGGLFAP